MLYFMWTILFHILTKCDVVYVLSTTENLMYSFQSCLRMNAYDYANIVPRPLRSGYFGKKVSRPKSLAVCLRIGGVTAAKHTLQEKPMKKRLEIYRVHFIESQPKMFKFSRSNVPSNPAYKQILNDLDLDELVIYSQYMEPVLNLDGTLPPRFYWPPMDLPRTLIVTDKHVVRVMCNAKLHGDVGHEFFQGVCLKSSKVYRYELDEILFKLDFDPKNLPNLTCLEGKFGLRIDPESLNLLSDELVQSFAKHIDLIEDE